MKTRLITAVFLLLSVSLFAQTQAIVRQQIATNLPDNNVQSITPAILRGTLYSIVNLITVDTSLKNRANHIGTQMISTITGLRAALDANTALANTANFTAATALDKANNAIDLSNSLIPTIANKIDNTYIIISPDGKSIKIKPAGTSGPTPPKIIELYEDFQTSAETATNFTYKTKPVFLKKIRVDNPATAQTSQLNFDELYSIEGRMVWTDANNYEQSKSIYSVTTNPYLNINTSTREVSYNDFYCESCTAKRYELTVMYTKQ